MKKTTKVVLFSTLICPGTGHFLLRRWWRGMIFLLPVLLAFGYYMNYSVGKAMDSVDRILSGQVSPDSASIEAMLNEKPTGQTAVLLSISKYAILLGWVVAAVDAYGLARNEMRSEIVDP